MRYPGDGLGAAVVGAVGTEQGSQILRLNQARCMPASTARSKGSEEERFPVAGGPQTTRFSRWAICSSVRNACWAGAGKDEAVGSQASKVFRVGKPNALRRMASIGPGPAGGFPMNKALMTSIGSHRRVRALAIFRGQRSGGGRIALPAQPAAAGKRRESSVLLFVVAEGLVRRPAQALVPRVKNLVFVGGLGGGAPDVRVQD